MYMLAALTCTTLASLLELSCGGCLSHVHAQYWPGACGWSQAHDATASPGCGYQYRYQGQHQKSNTQVVLGERGVVDRGSQVSCHCCPSCEPGRTVLIVSVCAQQVIALLGLYVAPVALIYLSRCILCRLVCDLKYYYICM